MTWSLHIFGDIWKRGRENFQPPAPLPNLGLVAPLLPNGHMKNPTFIFLLFLLHSIIFDHFTGVYALRQWCLHYNFATSRLQMHEEILEMIMAKLPFGNLFLKIRLHTHHHIRHREIKKKLGWSQLWNFHWATKVDEAILKLNQVSAYKLHGVSKMKTSSCHFFPKHKIRIIHPVWMVTPPYVYLLW